jgi:opacity protein-like surface antigen
MKKMLLAAAMAAAVFVPASAEAQVSGFGVGLVVGEPTGLTARGQYGSNSYQSHVAWSFKDEGNLSISLDYLRSLENAENIPLYLGLGLGTSFASDFGLNARVPVGVSITLNSAPVEIFGEFAPGLAILPEINFYWGLAAGGRYYPPS